MDVNTNCRKSTTGRLLRVRSTPQPQVEEPGTVGVYRRIASYR